MKVSKLPHLNALDAENVVVSWRDVVAEIAAADVLDSVADFVVVQSP